MVCGRAEKAGGGGHNQESGGHCSTWVRRGTGESWPPTEEGEQAPLAGREVPEQPFAAPAWGAETDGASVHGEEVPY